MAKTKIEWANFTWSPIVGCTKCSPGCDNCYAEKMAKRLAAMGQLKYCGAVNSKKKWSGEISYVPDPPKFSKKPNRIFVNSMSDTFHELVEFRWVTEIFSVAAQNPQHVFIILTKRAKRMHKYFQLAARPPRNVWLGVTVCNQAEANEKIPLLLKVPAAVRFVSIEPMLGEIDLTAIDAVIYKDHINALYCDLSPDDDLKYHGNTINWVICGGETGNKARPMHPDWVRSLRGQCKAAGVPFLFKQWGEYGPVNGDNMVRMGKHNSGRTLDGVIYDEYPIVKA